MTVVTVATYGTVVSGEVAGSTTAVQLPNVQCQMVRVRAALNNIGNVYVGGPGVTKPDGSTDTTTGYPLGPGDDTGWISVANLNKLYIICDNATDDIIYLAVL